MSLNVNIGPQESLVISMVRSIYHQKILDPRGLDFVIISKVDAYHYGDTVTRRSRTGFIIYMNITPVYWMSKKQKICESLSFGRELAAKKQCCEYIIGIW